MGAIAVRFAGPVIGFLAGAGLEVFGFEDVRVALGLWSFAGLWAIIALVFLKFKRRMPPSQQKESEDRSILAGDVRIITMPGIENLTPSVRFTTEGKLEQNFNLRGRPKALRFVTLGGRIVKEADLPVEIPCGKGKLVIKLFTDTGFSWDEVGTIGDRVQVEFYPLETSSS